MPLLKAIDTSNVSIVDNNKNLMLVLLNLRNLDFLTALNFCPFRCQ